jgi:hypothetical protein
MQNILTHFNLTFIKWKKPSNFLMKFKTNIQLIITYNL